MQKYAQIEKGKVTRIFIKEDSYIPVSDPNVLILVNITGNIPEPQVGWNYDSRSGRFYPKTDREKWNEIRVERDRRLALSDAWMVIDRYERYSNKKKREIKQYRQRLRDLPQNYADPDKVVWPRPPRD